MSNFVKQSTAVVVSYGPFVSKTDGFTLSTGLVSALDHATTGIKLSKNGGALTIRHATVTATTYDTYGMYRVTLDTTDTNTLGTIRMAYEDATTVLPVWQDFMVLPANIYDSIVSGSDLIDVSMTQILGTAVSSPATAGILDVNVKNIDNDAASASGTVTFPNATLASTTNITAGTITTVTTVTNQLTAAAIATGVWQDATAGDFTTASSIGKALYVANVAPGGAGGHFIAGSNAATSITTALTANITGNLSGSVGSVTGAVGSVTGNVGGNVTGSVGSVVGHTAQTGDAYARLGAPAGASVSADIAALPTAAENAAANWDEARAGHVAAGSFGEGVKVDSIADAAITFGAFDYQALQKDVFHGTALTAIGQKAAQLTWQSLSADYAPAGSFYVADSMGEQMTHLDADVSSAGGGLDAAGVRAAIGLASANLDTQLTAIDDYLDTEVAAIKAKTDLIPAAPASTTNITGGVITTVTNLTNAPTAGDLTAAMKASVTAAVPTAAGNAAAVWSEDPSSYISGQAGYSLFTIDERLPPVPASTTNITAGVITTVTNLTNLPAAAALEATLTAMKGATFAGATDSLEAIRDRGDAAWTTATGFSTLDAAGVRTAVGLASANLDTQLTAIDDLVDTEVTAIYNRIGAPAGASIAADIAGITATVDAADIRAAIGMAAADLDTQLGIITSQTDPGGISLGYDIGLAKSDIQDDIAALAVTLGAPAGASMSADIAAAKVDTAATKVKTDYLPSATAGAAGGLFIAGSNAATTVNITGNLSGSVGSVTGAVGSVTAAVTLPTAPTDWITAAAVKADAVTKIQNGLATPTNITAGVITTVTNLTNAPTNGDLTAAMKTSVTTAATAATPTAAAVTGAVGSVTGNVGGNVVGSVASVTGAVGSLTTNNDKTGYALTSAERNAVSDALLDRADAIATGITTRQGIQVILDVLAAKLSGAATATITVRDVGDTKNVLVYTTDSSGNRTAVVITP